MIMNESKEYFLIRSAADFKGAAFVKRLLNDDFNAVGFHKLNSYHSHKFKYDSFKKIDIVK